MIDKIDFAKDIALEAGRLAQNIRAERRNGDFIEEKGLQDFVTIADKKVEQFLRDAIAKSYPNDAILGEEDGWQSGDDGVWVLDPIDGTTNFMRGLSDWGICIAYVKDDEILLGVIFIPDADNLYWAEKDKGAFVNDVPLSVSKEDSPKRSLMTIGYANDFPAKSRNALFAHIADEGLEYRFVRAACVAAVRVAEGSSEVYYDSKVSAWDILAGILINAEAGGYNHHMPLSDFLQTSGPVVLSNGALDVSFWEKEGGMN